MEAYAGRVIIFCIGLLLSHGAYAQSAADSAAFKYKLSYDVPESPAFSILDANPNRVMRGSAAQEVVVHMANNFISSNAQAPGIAADFNPYFVFGGRLRSIDAYRGSENYFNRLLANAQLSIATIADQNTPDALLGSVGLRLTLFDKHDLLQNEKLGAAIDDALAPDIGPIRPGEAGTDEIVDNPKLTQAYDRIKAEMANTPGGALSVGFATAARMDGGFLKEDSVMNYRNQIWLAGQYQFGSGLMLLGTAMYRNTLMENADDMNELIAGVGVRYVGKKVNVGGELTYSSEMDGLELASNIEVRIMERLILFASIGNRQVMNGMEEDSQLVVKPGIKWNLSEPKR